MNISFKIPNELCSKNLKINVRRMTFEDNIDLVYTENFRPFFEGNIITLYYDGEYPIVSKNGQSIMDSKELSVIYKNLPFLKLLDVDMDATLLDIPLDTTYLEIQNIYIYGNSSASSLYRFQYMELPGYGRITREEYEIIADVIRNNDAVANANDTLLNKVDSEIYSRNTMNLLLRDEKFPSFFYDKTKLLYTADDENYAIDEFLSENGYESEKAAIFISNKGTEDEQENRIIMPEKILEKMKENLETLKLEEDEEKRIVYDEFDDKIDLKYVDEILLS